MKKFFLVVYILINKVVIPYRFKRLEHLYRSGKNRIAKHLFEFVGKEAAIRPNTKLSYFENIHLGERSSIGDRSMVVAADKVFIGNDVMMGPEVMIFTQNHEITPPNIRLIEGDTKKKRVTIEDDVWIGARAIILPGATIRTGCIVAAGAVVTGKEYAPYSVIGGNPAKLIKHRV